MGTLKENIHVAGHLTANSMTLPANSVSNDSFRSDGALVRSKLAQEALARFQVNLTDFRVWDAMQTVLPNPSANDDLGLYGGTFETDSPMIKTYDVKSAGALTFYARALIRLPAEYDDAETVQLRIHAEMQTTVADTTATIDIKAFESDREQGISADLCATGAQSMNNLVAADYDFTITATDLVSGDILDVRIAIAVNDAAGGGAVVAAVGSVELLCDIKG